MWSNLKATQEILDNRVLRDHDLESDEIYEERILALTDEIMEYAKTTKCFKYWSLKDPDPVHTRLEEFVDGIHFYLQWFNFFGIDAAAIKSAESLAPGKHKLPLKEGITFHITRALKHLMSLQEQLYSDEEMMEQLRLSFAHFWAAGILDGFTPGEIEKAYYIKNKENHERQNRGY